MINEILLGGLVLSQILGAWDLVRMVNPVSFRDFFQRLGEEPWLLGRLSAWYLVALSFAMVLTVFGEH